MKSQIKKHNANAELLQCLADIAAGKSPPWNRKTTFERSAEGTITRTITNEKHEVVQRQTYTTTALDRLAKEFAKGVH